MKRFIMLVTILTLGMVFVSVNSNGTFAFGGTTGDIEDIITDSCTYEVNLYTNGQSGTVCKEPTTGIYWTALRWTSTFVSDTDIVTWLVYYDNLTIVGAVQITPADRNSEYFINNPATQGLVFGDYDNVAVIYSKAGVTFNESTNAFFGTAIYHNEALDTIMEMAMSLSTSEGYDNGYEAGQDDIFINGSDTYGYNEVNSFDHDIGKTAGHLEVYNNGVGVYGLTLLTSHDFISGNQVVHQYGSDVYGYNIFTSFDYLLGINQGRIDVHNDGSTLYGLDVNTSEDFELGQIGIRNFGSESYGYTIDDSFDYALGLVSSVDTSIANFNNDFGKWIVPAIIGVLFIGGFFSMRAMKRSD